MLRYFYKIDKFLFLSIVLGLVFCLYGIQWGWVESWNPDQMAFRRLFNEGKLPFNPETFYKPPFHTYFNFLFSITPFYVIKKILGLSTESIVSIRLVWSRLLTVFLFVGSIVLVFQITKRFFGVFAARVNTIIFSTSAGFIAFSHFMTADIPVMFWMIMAFYFIQNIFLDGKTLDYLLAGIFTGIATATKYNGLGVGIAIVAAHVLSLDYFSWKRLLLDRKLYLGLFMVVIGFLLGNPFALLDYTNFITDFMYNYLVAPAYAGTVSGDGYLIFVTHARDIVGLPSFLLFLLAFIYSLCFLFFSSKEKPLEKRAVLLLLSAIALYYYKIGSFPRLPSRFVMPIVPFIVIIAGLFWNRIKVYHKIVCTLLVIIVGYNIVCSYYVGKRFSDDPRMVAQKWVKENIISGSSVESTSYVPHWDDIPGVNINDIRMPSIRGRGRLLAPLFEKTPFLEDLYQEVKDDKENETWYTLDQLIKRQPDYIAVDSLYYDRFIRDKVGELYPSIKQFFTDLLNHKYPYKIVFDQESPIAPFWVYPRKIDFLHNRITILSK